MYTYFESSSVTTAFRGVTSSFLFLEMRLNISLNPSQLCGDPAPVGEVILRLPGSQRIGKIGSIYSPSAFAT